MLVSVYVMLLFEHKQNLQSCGADISVQTEISSVKHLAIECLQKQVVGTTTGYFLVRDVTNPAPPGPCSKGSEAMLRWFREEEEN